MKKLSAVLGVGIVTWLLFHKHQKDFKPIQCMKKAVIGFLSFTQQFGNHHLIL